MKKVCFCLVLLIVTSFADAQSIKKIISLTNVERIERTLSADNMQGRQAFTPASEKAADFIASEFKKNGLAYLTTKKGYRQTFAMVSPKLIEVSVSVNGDSVIPNSVIPFYTSTKLHITEKSGFRKAYIKTGAQFRKEIANFLTFKEDVVVFVDSSFAPIFNRLNRMKQQLFKSEKTVVFILGGFGDVSSFKIDVRQELTEHTGSNVVGVIPGKSKKDEIVVFSGHYDHIGIEKGTNGDSVYNGANDDASGITAIIEMAKYYKAAKNNERTLVFAAFTAEEVGGFGSQYFSKQMDADKVVAMFNLEMIGTESKWGTKSAYITGFDKSDLGKILQKNLKGSQFNFYPDPYPEQDLFYRSDNATLAYLGVPAHTISTSKMDIEPNYHKLSDEVGTLNLSNMTEIIKSVIVSARSIVNGKDTPSRVVVGDLSR